MEEEIIKQHIDRARAHLGRYPHPDWLVKVLGIGVGEAEEALLKEGWEPPRGYRLRKDREQETPKAQPAPRPRLDLHNLPIHMVRWGLLALALIATLREFGFVWDYFQGPGGLLMALLISGGSTVLPQAVAVLWPRKGWGYKVLGLLALVLGLAVLAASIWTSAAGIWKASGEAGVSRVVEVQGRELGAIVEGLEAQVSAKAADLEQSRKEAQALEGWRKQQEQTRGDRIARELGELRDRLEARRLELSATEGTRTSLTAKAGEGVEVGMALLMSAIVSLIGPLALGGALWGGLDRLEAPGVESRGRRKK